MWMNLGSASGPLPVVPFSDIAGIGLLVISLRAINELLNYLYTFAAEKILSTLVLIVRALNGGFDDYQMFSLALRD